MLVNHIAQLTTALSVEPNPILKSLQIGQVLHALVLGKNKHDLLQLQIGNQRFTANTRPNLTSNHQTIAKDSSANSFQSGEKLKLIVIENKDNITLQILNRQNHQTTKPLLQQLLRQSLPHHTAPGSLISKFNSLRQHNPANPSPLSKPVIKQIIEMMASLPDAKTIATKQGLKQAVEHSGVFMEPRLQTYLNDPKPQHPQPLREFLQQDFKANLLRIKQVIEQNPLVAEQAVKGMKPAMTAGKTVKMNNTQVAVLPAQIDEPVDIVELKRLVDSAIARIQVNQASAIITEETQLPTWVIDLPVADKHEPALTELRISYEEYTDSETAQEKKWNVSITIELPVLGKITARVALLDNKITSSIWAENDHTYHLIEQHLEDLSTRMQSAGLDVDCIKCYPGSIPLNQRSSAPETNLLSIRI